MTFKNEAELKRFLMEKCTKAVANTERKVHEELAGNLNQFYTEYSPKEYIRTGALFNALESTGVIKTGNQHMNRVEAEVGFNTPQYEHGWMRLQSGEYDYSSWSDEEVLDVVMQSRLPHGGYESGTAIWTESMKQLGGKSGIKNLLKQELKKQGL
jgi:hypothetical protein